MPRAGHSQLAAVPDRELAQCPSLRLTQVVAWEEDLAVAVADKAAVDKATICVSKDASA